MDDPYEPKPELQSEPPSDQKKVACLSIDMRYVKSLHGILSAIIIFVSMIALICVRSSVFYTQCMSAYFGAYDFFGFVSGSAFLTGILHYIIHVLLFHKRFKFVPWHIADLVWCGIWSVLYLISSALILGMSCGSGGLITAGIFGFGGMVSMGSKGFLAYRDFQQELHHAQTSDVRGPGQPGALREVPPAYSPPDYAP